MLLLVQITQYIFCLVSMILTSLFAISLSGMSISEIGGDAGITGKIFSGFLFVLIGCCIDFGKYLFWSQRYRSHYYGSISLILTVFSLLATFSFFISAEISVLNNSRFETTEYIALQNRIGALTQEINDNERLLNSRLNSKYHRQWAEGEKNSVRIAELKDSLAGLIENSKNVGEDSAMRQVPITSFFTAFGGMLNVSAGTVRNVGYGLLALLLEVSILGVISLAHTFGVESSMTNRENGNSPAVEIPESDSELREKISKLSCDIIQGKVQPVARTIKAAQYGVDIYEIKKVLINLYLAGLIDKAARKSYKLKDSFLTDKK